MNRPGIRSVDFVLPIYNEAHVLARSVATLQAALNGFDLPPWRVLIMDNGSVDGSEEVGRALAGRCRRVRYQRLEVKGRGLALRTAWMRSGADAALYMDIDLSTDLAAVPEVVRGLDEGADLVVGSRLAPGSRTRRCLKREFLSRGYNLLIRALFRPRGFDDAQCGFKAVRLDAVRRILPLVENDHWFFDTELLLVAEAAGLDVRSVPVAWVEDADTRVRIGGTVIEDLRGLARVRLSLGRKLSDLAVAGVA